MGENFTARIFKFFEPSVFFEFLKDNAIKILLGIVIYKLGVFGSKYIDKFFKLVKDSFKQKRKNLRNNLKLISCCHSSINWTIIIAY